MKDETTSSNPIQDDGKPDMSKPVTDSVEDIVSKAAKAIGSGKSFGGWTDNVQKKSETNENRARQGATPAGTIKVKLGKSKPAGASYREKVSSSDLEAAGSMYDRLRGSGKQGKPIKDHVELNEIAFLAPLAAQAARFVGSKMVRGLAKKTGKAALTNVAQSAWQKKRQQMQPEQPQEGVIGGVLKAAGRYAKDNPLETGVGAIAAGRALKNKMAERKARKKAQQQGNSDV